MSLVDHARRELELIGEEPAAIEMYISVVQAFSQFGHSGGPVAVAIPVINRLLKGEPLSELTDNPDEWIHHTGEVWPEEGGIWQNVRDSRMFSHDGGKTCWNVEQATQRSRTRKYLDTTKDHRRSAEDPIRADRKDWVESLDGQGETQNWVDRNRYNPDAFTQDGGKTYYLLSEGATHKKPVPAHDSEVTESADV